MVCTNSGQLFSLVNDTKFCQGHVVASKVNVILRKCHK